MKTLLKNSNRNTSLQSPWYSPLNRFFRNDFINLWDDRMETIPSINIKEEKENYKIEMAAPGLKKEDFNIDVDGNILTISSEKESETKDVTDSENFSRREYNYSSFTRSLSLPDNADSNKIAAKYEDGVLRLSIPKKEGMQNNNGKKIKVE
jgi:HSP20 family protein